MPPKAQPRRRSRERNSAALNAQVDNRLVNFQKPNLPTLQGTPSSRRQYSYGSALEPAPARQARRAAPGNLASAVQDALSSSGRGGDVEVFINRKSQQRPQASRAITADQDELLGSEADYRPSPGDDNKDIGLHSDALDQAGSPAALPDTPKILLDDDDDLSDARSFGMEDDYYDGAVIGSVNGDVFGPPAPPNTLPPLTHGPAPQTFGPSSRQNGNVRGAGRGAADPDVLPFTDDDLDLDLPPLNKRPNGHASTLPGPGTNVNADRSDASALVTPPETDSQLSQEAESARNSFEHPIGAPKPSFLASLSNRGGFFQPMKSPTNPTNAPSHTSGFQVQNSRRQLNISSTGPKADFFGRRSTSRAPDPPGISSWFSPRRSERGDSVLRHSLPTDPGDAPQRRQGAAAHNQRKDSLGSDFSNGSDDGGLDWLQVLNPSPHCQAAWSYLKTALDSIFNVILTWLSHLSDEDFQERMRVVFSKVIYAIALAIGIVVFASFFKMTLDKLPNGMPEVSITPGNFPVILPSLGQMTGRIGQWIPSFSRKPVADDFEYIWDEGQTAVGSGDRRFQKMEEWLRDLHRELGRSKDSSQMHEASIKKLEFVVPKLVHMTLKDGKPAVAPEFWHAIRDLIHQDDSFLSLQKKGNEYDFANEKQWRSIVSRLNKDPAFASQLNASVDRIEGRVGDNVIKKLPAFWDSWVANNENRISRMVGTAVDKIVLPKTPKDIEARISELVKKHMNADTGGGVVVTRDEFLRHLKNEFAAHRTEIKAEISELQPKLERMVQDSIALTKEDLPDGMAKAEVERLVQTLVSKSIADMNLEALAKGRIYAHWDQDLRNQVNYFGVGAGAIINPKYTSATYKPGSEDINRRGLLAIEPLPPIDALMPWLDDGNCWCGARGANRRGNPYDVKLAVDLGHSIIPQQVVMEHIIPLATTDAGARPKDIEVYASIDDPEVRSRVQDFAEAHFPVDKDDWQYAPANLPHFFVKIGQFVYEGAERHDGVHVHHLSTELLALGAETDQVVIRATSNYGAEKHTCFYRVRLFGKRTEGPPVADTDAGTSRISGWRWKLWG